MKRNLSNTDRIVRVVVAALFAYLYFGGIVTGILGIVLVESLEQVGVDGPPHQRRLRPGTIPDPNRNRNAPKRRRGPPKETSCYVTTPIRT